MAAPSRLATVLDALAEDAATEEDLWLRAREAAIDAALAEGRHPAVLGELDELVREHPLRERLHVQRMLALYRSGRQADALEAFRHARTLLLDEVGLEPGSELRRLNDAILRQDPELDGPPAGRYPGRPRRPHRLLFAAAGAAPAGVVALAVTQLTGSGGLDRIAEDSAGVIDPGSGKIVAQSSVGHTPDALVAGGGSVWTANGRDGTVSRVDRGGQVMTIDVGGEPTAPAFDHGSLWVADGQNRRVDQIDARTNRIVRRAPAGNAPRGVAVAGGAVWLASAVDGQVERLDLMHAGRSRPIDAAPPALVTPPFPDHPSGHNCAAGAIVRTLRYFFGTDNIAFTATSSKSGTTRTFHRFSDALRENINARVWAGIHFRAADVQAAALGKQVARYLHRHYFQPVD